MKWSVSGLSVRFGKTPALLDVNMVIEPGTSHAVIGGDGAGKSTLLKVLAGLDVGQHGHANLPDREQIAYVPSSGGIFPELTVSENMEFVADAYGLRAWRERAHILLERAAIVNFGDRISGRMSGGQRHKLAGVMALLPRPRLLLLDEVTTGLDPVSRMELWRLIAGATADGAAVVASTTYLDEAERAGSVLLLHAGRVLAEGTPDAIIDSVRGSITTCIAPSNRALAWRRGATWRQWDPEGAKPDDAITLEDAAITFELSEERGIA